MTPGRLTPWRGAVVLLGVLPWVLAPAGCTRAVDGVPTAAPSSATPSSAAELEELVVTEVPSGLPRLADDELQPPAGEKDVEDLAGYSRDPGREQTVLEDYGYRFGWERFWGAGGSGPMTGVFVDQFDRRAGADAYAADRARNYAETFDGVLVENPPDFPGGCWLLTVEDPVPHEKLSGPAVLVSCGHGAFSVAVTAMADSLQAAQDEVRAVLEEQMAALPPH